MAENVRLQFWVKRVCARSYTQRVPKWHLAGQLAGPDFFNMRARPDAQKIPRFRREGIWVDSAC